MQLVSRQRARACRGPLGHPQRDAEPGELESGYRERCGKVDVLGCRSLLVECGNGRLHAALSGPAVGAEYEGEWM